MKYIITRRLSQMILFFADYIFLLTLFMVVLEFDLEAIYTPHVDKFYKECLKIKYAITYLIISIKYMQN